MLSNPTKTKSMSFSFEHSSNPNITVAQVFSDCSTVVIAYSKDAGCILDADLFWKSEHPELENIVREMPNDDVWDLDMVLSLVEPVDPSEYASDYTEAWVSGNVTDFQNLTQDYRAAV